MKERESQANANDKKKKGTLDAYFGKKEDKFAEITSKRISKAVNELRIKRKIFKKN